MASFEDARKGLADDVASLTRVRNRFARSSDRQLHTIMPALIPKLFKRLEKYRTLIMNENEDYTNVSSIGDSTISLLEEAKKNIHGILATAMERLRGDGTIPAESLVQSMLPFMNSSNPVVVTWAMAFLQVSFQRIPLTNFSLSSSCILPLLESLGQLHNKLKLATEASAIDSSLEAQWASVSWLLLDSIVLTSGQKPMVDWDKDTFDTAQIRWTDDGGTANKNQSFLSSHLMEDTRRASDRCSAQGFFSLIFDLLLYWPDTSTPGDTITLSPLGLRRMEHRSKITHSENVEDQDQIFPPVAADDMQARFRRLFPGRRRVPATTKWSNASRAYLRYMKFACLDFAISSSSWGVFQDLNDEYAILLSILFASHDSMHGRIVVPYLNKWMAENSLIPLSVVTTILVLVVGEAQAEELLKSFKEKHKTNFWEQLLGPNSRNENIQRPAINWTYITRAANFIIENPLKWSVSTKSADIDPCVDCDNTNDEAFANLFIELSLKLSEVDDDEHKFLAMRLVSHFYRHIQRPQTTIVLKILDLIISVLSLLPKAGVGEELRISLRQNAERTVPVPIPFPVRNDLNQLLQNHRRSMKRKNLNRDNAIQARVDAYTMVPHLCRFMFERSDASRFQFPILLLQCAVFEERSIAEYLNKALDSILVEYKKKFDEDQSLFSQGLNNGGASSQQQATFILPALLEAVCSGAPNVRMHAIRWIEKLLVNMDAEAACCLATYLVHDESSIIARMAKAILDNAKINSSPIVFRDNFFVSFIDLRKSGGLMEVQYDLKNRSKELAQRLQISCEESMVLLLHFKFSVSRAEFEYRNSPMACRELCGLVFVEKPTMNEETIDGVECGICYEEVEAKNTYSLPCGHKFCKACWVSYVTDASKETPSMNFLDLRCPHHDCNTRVMLHDLQRLKPCLIPKWNDAILRKFVEEDVSYRYCSGPDCGCVAVGLKQSEDTTPKSLKVTCNSCSTSFCFGCGENPHAPALCSDIAKWNLLKGSSQLWVKHNSKPCPGCNVPIEKNQGCNHMKCSHCNTDFCWLCLSVLDAHLPHVCNRYDSIDSAEDDFERQALFTVKRYEAHDVAAEFTLDQYKSFDAEKLLETFWFLDEDEDPEVLAEALKTLLAARDFVKNSYVAMMGLRGHEKNLKRHEEHHACLEMFTERLSQLTETNLHRLYTLEGQLGIRLHFRRLAFYAASVTKYMERMAN